MDLLQKLYICIKTINWARRFNFTSIEVYYAPCFYLDGWGALQIEQIFIVDLLLKRFEGQQRLMEAIELQERERKR